MMTNDFEGLIGEDGRIKVDEASFTFCDEEKVIDGYFAENWIQVFGGNKYLIKTLVTNKYESTGIKSEDKMFQQCELNAILMPFILKQFGIETASYYLGIFKGKNVILTPTFLSEDEELVSGEKIMSDHSKEVTDIYKILKALKKRKVDKEIRKKFLLQVLASKIVNQTDERNRNWGIIYKKGTMSHRLAPMFDFDFCGPCCNNFMRRYISDMSYFDMNLFIEEFFRYDFVKEFIMGVVDNFDLEKAFNECEIETKINIPKNDKDIYRRFFMSTFRSMNSFLDAKKGRKR